MRLCEGVEGAVGFWSAFLRARLRDWTLSVSERNGVARVVRLFGFGGVDAANLAGRAGAKDLGVCVLGVCSVTVLVG